MKDEFAVDYPASLMDSFLTCAEIERVLPSIQTYIVSRKVRDEGKPAFSQRKPIINITREHRFGLIADVCLRALRN
jgi:hypothetical protein